MNISNYMKEQLPVFEGTESLDMIEWFKNNSNHINETILKHGGILIRGFEWSSVSEFNKVAQIVCPELLDYVYRSTPRTRLGGKIYTATEYPAERTIPQHNENAYSRSWPRKIIFGSVLVADTGGETPITDSRSIYNKIPKKIREDFEEKKVMYVRNYRPNVDLSWQEVFQTDKKEEVELYCHHNNIQYEWNVGSAELRTKQICQSILLHPDTKEKVWFNQAHLFHVSGLPENDKNYLIKEFGIEGLPRNSFYGDGSEIDVNDLNTIRQIYENEQIVFPWKRGDIMILDNILMTHGRMPFTGERKVVVAMG